MNASEIGEVVVRCPITGEAVPVGMEISKATFERTTLYGNQFKCACGSSHVWRKADAWVRVQPD